MLKLRPALHSGIAKSRVGISHLHVSAACRKSVNPQGESSADSQKKLYYYDMPGNSLNPHTYFYRVLAVPYLKFCGMIIGTYYLMCGVWYLLDKDEKSKGDSDN